MEGSGPLHGTHHHLGKIVLSDDPVAADFTFARLMGLHPERVWHLNHGPARFFGNGCADRIVFLADGLPERVVLFSVLPELAYLRMPVPLR